MNFRLNQIESEEINVFYRTCGPDNAPTIIFVHGMAGDSRFFHNQLKFFGSKMNTIAIDLPGHGKSFFEGELSIETYNRSIEAVVANEKIGSYILAGHSMGGAVCIENYLSHREMVKGLILISTSARLPVDHTMLNESLKDFDSFFNRMLATVYDKKAGIFILAAQKNLSDYEKRVIIKDLELCTAIDHESNLEEIDIPVLLIANRYDMMVPSSLTADMMKRIKNSKLVQFENRGHVPFFENSSEFNIAVKEFLESLR